MHFFRRKKLALQPLPTDISAVRIDGHVIPVEVVSTKEMIDRGLSGREQLEASAGMLFLFDHTARFRFWMRGMRFPLDFIWIGANMQVVDITKNVPPLPDDAEAIFYSPAVPALYVLEVNAGFCEGHNINLGEVVEFISP